MAFISLTDLIYPVGSYFLSNSSTSPASLFGGGWSALTGRFLYCNSGTGTGGSNTHTLTTSEMPSHTHSYYRLWTSPGGDGQLQWGNAGFSLEFNTNYTSASTGGGLLTTICQRIKRAIVGIEPLNLCGVM